LRAAADGAKALTQRGSTRLENERQLRQIVERSAEASGNDGRHARGERFDDRRVLSQIPG
jgi:hypothetical protein